MIDWTHEKPIIRAAANLAHVDPAFVMAIRTAESGAAGIEFGVEPPGKYTYTDQLAMTINTVAHKLAAYHSNPFTRTRSGRLTYSQEFIQFFASTWAPMGALNDPTHLNANWPHNCELAYADHIAQGD